MCARGGACAALLLLLLELAAADLERRADMSPMPFVMGSRYGRSSQAQLISPRNDRSRFFMGSRYGKRSAAEGVAGEGGEGEEGGRATAVGAGAGLMCEYTGVMALYRCARHHQTDHYDARSADEAGLAEQD